MIRKEEVYRIGRIGKPHGVHGELQMQYSDDVFDRTDAAYLVLDMEGILVPFFMDEYRFRSDEIVLMKFCDVDTAEQARQLTGSIVYFPCRLAEAAGGDSLSWAQIVGFTLQDARSGQVIGEIQSVDDTTANILFEVRTPSGTDLLVPASSELITDMDTTCRTIKAHIPEGLLEL